jgi:hypothetical protein
MAVVLLGVVYVLGWDSTRIWVFLSGSLLVTISRYVWWHFRPYKAPEPHPLTRYTNPRHTKT